MITLYNWGENTHEGVWLDHIANDDMHILRNIIGLLKSVNTYLIAYNDNQVIIGDMNYIDSGRYSDRIQFNKIDIDDLKARVSTVETDIMRLYNEQEEFKIKFPKNENNSEEVTEDFFIMIDMLPEHIRKELKIYIKNDNIIQKG